MTVFAEFTELDGEKVLISLPHVVKVRPVDNGVLINLDVVTGNDSSVSMECVHVEETYSVVKRKLSE